MADSDFSARLRSLASDAGLSISRFEEVPGDVGRRRYYRLTLTDNSTALAVLYAPEEEDARRRWTRIREALEPRVRVPSVLADDEERLQILEDFGSQPLARVWRDADSDSRQRLMEDAARVAARIAATPDPGANPPFSADLFFAEMEKSRTAIFELWGSAPLSPGERDVHDEFARELAREIDSHPRAFLHRDFHADNLHVIGGELGVIDFQDARIGPDSYDLASLLKERDTLLRYDERAEQRACELFVRATASAPGLPGRLRRVRLQRAWKVVGTFAREAAGGQDRYRPYLKAGIGLVLELLGKTKAEEEFSSILSRRSAKLLN